MKTQRVVFCISVFAGLLLSPSISWAPLATAATADSVKPSSKASDHVSLSTPVVKAWLDLPVGVPIYTIDDWAATKGWLEQALVQQIGFQSGIWHIHIEPGYTVFRIYPFLKEGDRQPRAYQGIVLKVNGNLTVADLLAAIRERKTKVVLDEYELFGDGISAQKYSRPGSGADRARRPAANKALHLRHT